MQGPLALLFTRLTTGCRRRCFATLRNAADAYVMWINLNTVSLQVARMNPHLISARDCRRMTPVRSRVLGFAIGIWGSLAAASCSHDTPAAPTTVSNPQGDTIATIELPIAPGDAANVAYGIWPFGVHGSSHAVDGHPGFDVEYRVGASVREIGRAHV